MLHCILYTMCPPYTSLFSIFYTFCILSLLLLCLPLFFHLKHFIDSYILIHIPFSSPQHFINFSLILFQISHSLSDSSSPEASQQLALLSTFLSSPLNSHLVFMLIFAKAAQWSGPWNIPLTAYASLT